MAVSFAHRCSYRFCCNERLLDSTMCEDHDNAWSKEAMQHYSDLREDGHSAYAAAIMAGLSDPPDNED